MLQYFDNSSYIFILAKVSFTKNSMHGMFLRAYLCWPLKSAAKYHYILEFVFILIFLCQNVKNEEGLRTVFLPCWSMTFRQVRLVAVVGFNVLGITRCSILDKRRKDKKVCYKIPCFDLFLNKRKHIFCIIILWSNKNSNPKKLSKVDIFLNL